MKFVKFESREKYVLKVLYEGLPLVHEFKQVLLWDSDLAESIITFQALTLYHLTLDHCCHLVSLLCDDTGKAQVLESDDGFGSGSQRKHFSIFKVDR